MKQQRSVKNELPLSVTISYVLQDMLLLVLVGTFLSVPLLMCICWQRKKKFIFSETWGFMPEAVALAAQMPQAAPTCSTGLCIPAEAAAAAGTVKGRDSLNHSSPSS